jgi:acetoin utilization protein AcuC
MEAAFICTDDLWAGGFGDTHPLKPERLKRTYELLAAYRAFEAPTSHLVAPRPATREDLLLFHTAEYVDAVARMSRGKKNVQARRYGFRPDETPVFPGMYEVEGLKAGAGLTGARLVYDGAAALPSVAEGAAALPSVVEGADALPSALEGQVQVAFSFAGGLHHARPALASGFCVFNDVAIAIHWLLRQGLRVAYVDVDVHHGDGVQAAFYDTDQVLTISLHQAGILFYPGTGFSEELGTGAGFGYSINLPFLIYTSEELYLWTFRQVVPPLVRQFAPDVLVTQLGVDTHYRDRLGSLLLTTRGYVALVEAFKSLADSLCQGCWLAFGGGGYAVDVVPRAWTLAYGVMSGQTFPDELPPAYSERYGPGHLRDTAGPEPTEGRAAEETRQYVEKNLDILRERTRDVWRWE